VDKGLDCPTSPGIVTAHLEEMLVEFLFGFAKAPSASK